MAIYGDRVALLPQLLQILHYHPDGMRFSDLAHEVGRSEADIRETLRVYHLTDLAHYLPNLVARPDVLEFLADDPEDDGDPSTATLVRLGDPDFGEELGVTHVTLEDLARLYRVASDALALSPGGRGAGVGGRQAGRRRAARIPDHRTGAVVTPRRAAHGDPGPPQDHDHVRPRLVTGDRGAGDRAAAC